MKKHMYVLVLGLLVFLPNGLAEEDKGQKELMDEYSFNYNKADEITKGKKSLEFSLRALEIATRLKDEDWVAEACNQVASGYEGMGDLKTALSYVLRAAKIYEDVNNKKNMGFIYDHIGTIYLKQGNIQLAIHYLNKAIGIHKKYNLVLNEGQDYVNLGEVYRVAKNYDMALRYFNLAYAIFSGNKKEEKAFAYVVGNMGLVYAAQGKMELANRYLDMSTQILEKIGDFYPIAVYLTETAEIYFKNGQTNEALTKAKEALALSIRENRRAETRDAYKLLADIYTRNADYRNAFLSLREYGNLKDSIVNGKVVGDMAEMRADYEVSKRETEIKGLQEVNRLRNRLNIIMGISVVLVVVLMLFLFTFNNDLKKANTLLSAQKQEVEVKNDIIRTSLLEKETLLKEIHHRVKNNLQIISSLLSLQSHTVKNKKVLEAFQESQQRLHSIALIHQKLYQNENLASIAMQEYMDELVGAIHYTLCPGDRNIRYVLDIGDICLDIDTAVPLGLIVNELATNAYKYAFNHVEDGILTICLERTGEKQCRLTVKDNGPGLPVHLIIMETESLGLRLVTTLSRQLQGQLETKSDGGAEFSLVFTEVIQHNN
jgi:two-component system, sensor histidine kinase PdtaS